MPAVIDKKECNACGICVRICPTDVFYGSKTKEIPVVMYPEECWHCNACVHDCPQDAIHLRVPLTMQVAYKS